MPRGLRGIIRFRRHQVDESRRALGALLGHAAELRRRAAALEIEIVDEQRVASEQPEQAGFAYGRFAAKAIDRRAELARETADVENAIQVAQEGVRRQFRGLKVFEIAQDDREIRERKEAERAAQAVLDEIGAQFRRRADD